MKSDLSTYNTTVYTAGSKLKCMLWYTVSLFFFKGSWNISSPLKVVLLRFFGASVGKGVVIKQSVNIKYPWKLSLGNHCWIGEGVWIDNLDQVTLEDHVCLSQGALLLCGNHNYKTTSFDLMIAPIYLKEGSWIGAKASVGPGVTSGSHAVLSMGAIATRDLSAYTVYGGNPAKIRNTRKIVKQP
jgi:putative colanic acid biosynthesis acetyltransferase WcaF